LLSLTHGRIFQYQASHLQTTADRRRQRNRAAPRMSDHRHRLQTKRGPQALDLGSLVRQAVACRRAVGVTMSLQIDSDDARPRRQRRSDAYPASAMSW